MNEEVKHNREAGESYGTILNYFYPELITAIVVYSLINIVDAKLIADLKTTSMYIILTVTSTLINFITKIAEGMSVGTIVLTGQYNGKGDDRSVGVAAISSLWTTMVIGALVSGFLYFGAASIYRWHGVTEDMVAIGVPFLQLRAVGIFFMFIYFSFIGFFRGIKRPRVPMALFMLGAAFFLFFDFALVKGLWGFPALGMQGSAIAFLIQHIVMSLGALIFILTSPSARKYGLRLFKSLDAKAAYEIMVLSWPVMLDKGTIAGAKIWLGKLVAPAGAVALASCGNIRDLTQLAFNPAVAFAQVLTFLVSNNVGAGNWLAVKKDIKRVLILAVGMCTVVFVLFSVFIRDIVGFFDPQCIFTDFASQAFPVLSALVLFDLLQLILSAALRGAADVKTVMMVRVVTVFLFFLPVSWLFSRLPIENQLIKFILVLGSFYLNDAIMSLLFIKRLSGTHWYHRIVNNFKVKNDGDHNKRRS